MQKMGPEKKNWQEREKEIRSESRKNREKIILRYAREISNKEGFNGLNLPLLAETSGFSKPTVYKYFPNREDLMTALVVESASRCIACYEKVLAFKGRPREKLYELHSLNFGILNQDFRDWLYILIERVEQKASPFRQKLLDAHNAQILEIHASIIREAIVLGDLKLPETTDEYQFMFTLVASTIGGCVLKESESAIIRDWFKKIRFMPGTLGKIVLDGVGWKPMADEWDYAKSLERFYREMFPEIE